MNYQSAMVVSRLHQQLERAPYEWLVCSCDASCHCQPAANTRQQWMISLNQSEDKSFWVKGQKQARSMYLTCIWQQR